MSGIVLYDSALNKSDSDPLFAFLEALRAALRSGPCYIATNSHLPPRWDDWLGASGLRARVVTDPTVPPGRALIIAGSPL